MAQQGKLMRVGAREGVAYHSVKLVILANGNRYEAHMNMFKVRFSIRSRNCHVPTLNFYDTHSYL